MGKNRKAFETHRAHLESEYRQAHDAGDKDTAEARFEDLEKQHWGRWRGHGGPLTTKDVVVQSTKDTVTRHHRKGL
jgi:hypothetical protein